MEKIKLRSSCVFIILFLLTSGWIVFSVAQEALPQKVQVNPLGQPDAAKESLKLGPGTDRFTLDLNGSDILDALKMIASKSGMNIIAAPEVAGTVTVKLTDVTWDKALETILDISNLGYQKDGNIIIVAPIEKIAFFKKQESTLMTEVFNLKYLDAQLTQTAIRQLLSPRGKTAILQTKKEAGWEFAGGKGESFGKQKRESGSETAARSNTLIVTDIPEVIEKIREVVKKIDVRPPQILIETKIIEVKKDELKDLGLDWATGSTGAESSTVTQRSISQNGSVNSSVGGHSSTALISPYGFTPLGGTTATPVSATYPFNLGPEVVFSKLKGYQFEVIAHALEQNAKTNTLSAPRILALNNQEATILVGTKYPILQSNITGAGSVGVTTVTLDYYQDIGVQLKVIPQVGAGNDINMVIHPAVTSYTQTVGANAYPIILTREAETRVVMKDGETIVIGGLLIDEKTKGVSGIPILKDLPFLGKFFRRDTVSTDKLDLLIFITASIVKEGDSFAGEIGKAEASLTK